MSDDKEYLDTTTGSDTPKEKEQKDQFEKVCFMCRRPESKAGKMIDLPNNIHICTDCMQKSFDTMNNTNINYEELMKNMPNISMIDLNSLQNQIPQRQKVKKKQEQPKEKTAQKVFDIRVFRRLTESKRVWTNMSSDRNMPSYVCRRLQSLQTCLCRCTDDVEIRKINMLMIGPTGSGKTYMVKTLARLLDVPLAITDATSLTEAGYIGDDIESVVSKLLAAADNDVERAEHGIIFIDEIDKIAKKKNTNQRDVSGEAVQQGMLKLLEGSEVEVPVGANSKNAMVPLATVNTKNILFICGGAFPDLEEIIKERLNKTASIGFQADLKDKYDHDNKILEKVTVDDLKKFGMIPEFLGRMPIIFTLSGLDRDMLVEILKEPKNAILKQYQKLLALDEVKLEFEDGALEAIADMAMEKHTGGRSAAGDSGGIHAGYYVRFPKTITSGSDYYKKITLPTQAVENFAERTGACSDRNEIKQKIKNICGVNLIFIRRYFLLEVLYFSPKDKKDAGDGT